MTTTTTASAAGTPDEASTPEAVASTSSTAATRALIDSVDTVKQLLAAGLLDPTALGMAPSDGHGAGSAVETDTATPQGDAARQGSLPTWFLVPGEPITVRDLMAKTRAVSSQVPVWNNPAMSLR